MPPAWKLAVVTCMDARLHPETFPGLELGDAHVIRNAGGCVSDDNAEKEVFAYLRDHGIGVVVRGPLKMGILTTNLRRPISIMACCRER